MTEGEASLPLPTRIRRALGPAACAALLLLLGWDLLDRPPSAGAAVPAEDAAATAARVERGIAGVLDRFHEVERRALHAADSLAPRVLEAVPHPTDAPEDRAALFEVLSRTVAAEGGELSGAAVVDREGRALAWRGRVFAGPKAPAPGNDRSTRVVRTNVYKVVVAEVPLTGPGGDTAAAVRVYAPFNANFPLHNRYLRRIDFEAEAAEALGLEKVNLDFGPPEEPADDPPPPGTGRAPLRGILGDHHAVLEVAVPPPEQAAAVAHRDRTAWRRALLGTLILLAVALDGLPVRRLPGGWPRWVARAGLVAAARFAWIALDFPSRGSLGEVFDLSAFSVTWLGGALRTPGDALLTGMAALAASLLLVRALPRPGEGRIPAAARAAALAGAAATAWAGWEAFLALARAVAFQSQVVLFPIDRVLPSPPAAALHLAVAAVLLAFLVPASRLLSVAAGRPLPPGSPAGRALAAAVLAAFATHLSVQWHALEGLRQDALATVDRLDSSGEREERVALENLVERMAGPDALAGKALRGRGPRQEDAAFFLWARTPELNGRPDGCALDILGPGGEVLSRFDIDIPPRSWLPEPLPVPPPGGETVAARLPGRKGAAQRTFLLAAATVRDGGDAPQGWVRLCVPAAADGRRGPDRPEILRNYAGVRPPPEGRAVHRAVFDGDRLRECTNPDYPRGMRAPREAVERVLEKGEPLVWVREEVAGIPYHNAYMPAEEGGRTVGLLSVGFPSLEPRDLWLNLAKEFFLLVLAGSAAGAAAAGVALARGWRPVPSLGYRVKILAGFVVVGGMPVAGLAVLERSLAEERASDTMHREVVESLRLVEASLRDAGVLEELVALAAPGAPATSGAAAQERIPDERVKEIAYRAGVPVNLFLDDRLLASSERGIYATELFPPRLAGSAYRQVVLLGRQAYAAPERFGSFPFLVGYAPVRGPGGEVVGVISVPLLYRQDRADRDLARTTTVALALYFVVLLAVAGAGTVLARRMARPVESLAEGTRRVAAGDLAFRIPRGTRDELGDLVDSFNRMTVGLEAGREAAARAEREAAWREMAKQVAHEIKNPLTPMRLHAQHLLRAHRDGAEDLPQILEKAADTIMRQTEALRRIASDFSAFARLPQRSPEPLDPAALLRETADLYRGSEGVEVVLEAPEEAPRVYADREEMRLVLVNLCGNAVESMPSGGRLLLSLRAAGDPPREVVLVVEDTGVGIPPEYIPRLFDPSFSTKTRGTGLGLAIVRRAVEDASGRVEVRSQVGRGTAFTVTWPAWNG